MNNTLELIVLRANRGKKIHEAIKALDQATEAYKEREMIQYQRIYNLGQFIECKYLLQEIDNLNIN